MQLSTLSLGLTSSGEELCANCRLNNIHSTTTESHRRLHRASAALYGRHGVGEAWLCVVKFLCAFNLRSGSFRL